MELTEKLPLMIGIIDNNEVINEFYKLIEPDLLKMPKGCLVIVEPITVKLHKSGDAIRVTDDGEATKGENSDLRRNYWSLKTVTFVFEIMLEVKILRYFFCRADKNRQF